MALILTLSELWSWCWSVLQKYRGSLLDQSAEAVFLKIQEIVLFFKPLPWKGELISPWLLWAVLQHSRDTGIARCVSPRETCLWFFFSQTPLQSFCLRIQEKKGISKWIICNLKHARRAFLKLCNCGVASAEARTREHKHNYERGEQSQLTSSAEYVTSSLASACCPLSSFPARHASLCRKQFLLWCQNPTAWYVVHTKAEEAKKEEGKQMQGMRTKNAVLSVTNLMPDLFSRGFLMRKSDLGKEYQKDSAVVFKSDLAPTS